MEYILTTYYREINRILKNIPVGSIEGAINWADLSCTEVFEWRNQDGDSGFTAYIEESSPDCSKLKEHVLRELKKRVNIDKLEIRCQW